MTWEGSVTDRGTEAASGAASVSSDSFAGTANSLIIAVVFTSGETLTASDVSGHAAGGGWTMIDSVVGVTSARRLYLFAAINGSSPSAETIVVNGSTSYIFRLQASFYEITDVDTSGTVSEAFGTPATDEEYPGNGSTPLSFTIGSHSNAEGLTIAVYGSYSGSTTYTLDTSWTGDTDSSASLTTGLGYISGEDTSFEVLPSSYTQHLGIGVEVVGIAAGGGLLPRMTLLGVG